MSARLKLNNNVGGSTSLVCDDSQATDEVVVISATEVQVKSPDNSVWAIRVDNAGAITATKV